MRDGERRGGAATDSLEDFLFVFFLKKVGSGLLARAVIGQLSRKLGTWGGIRFGFAFLICCDQIKKKHRLLAQSNEMMVALPLLVLELSVYA